MKRGASNYARTTGTNQKYLGKIRKNGHLINKSK
jgi:hypothetical protein